MTTPDPYRSPEGGAVPPEARATGQRALAAVVPTDAVGSSRLISWDEELALRLMGVTLPTLSRPARRLAARCEVDRGQAANTVEHAAAEAK